MARFNIQPVSPPSAGSIVKYMVLPGILPRLKNLGHIFSRILFIFTRIFGLVGLIDAAHPCLRPENIGRHSFSESLILAWRNVRFDRAHVLQTTMFFSVITAVVLLIGILLSASGYMFSGYTSVVHAQYFGMPTATSEIPYKPESDWSFIFLERVFGGKAQTGVDFWIRDDKLSAANPWYTGILIGMLKTYSQALLWIATFMILYLLLNALVSAARSGKPFGEKFDSVWAPIRFCIAIGLLLPVSGSGYNGAQMLAFQSAEWGSNLATNLWHKAVSTKSSDKNNFIAATVSDPGYRFVRDMFLINLCVSSYNQLRLTKKIPDVSGDIRLEPKQTWDGNTIIFSFGNRFSPDFCGSVIVPNFYKFQKVPKDYTSGSSDQFLPKMLANQYNESIRLFQPDLQTNLMRDTVENMTKKFYCTLDKSLTETMCSSSSFNCTLNVEKWIDAYWERALGRNTTDDRFFAQYQASVDAYNAWLYETIQSDAQYGWASAGSFYLRMSYALSTMQDVISNAPHASKLPVNLSKRFALPKDEISNEAGEIACGDGKATPEKCSEYAGAMLISDILNKGAKWFADAPLRTSELSPGSKFYEKVGPEQWDAAMKRPTTESSDVISPDAIMGYISAPLLAAIQIDTGALDPLGRVIGWGNNMIVTAGSMLTTAAVLSTVGKYVFGALATSAAKALVFIAKILIVPGFFLMFVIPMLPFMYFTFAVIEWIVSIVEAVIGLPLWALTFITGEGSLMEEAMGGIQMLFEIVLRPTIIVMSLLSAVIIFTGAVAYFNEAFNMYVNMATNHVTPTGSLSGALSWGPDMLGGLGMIFVYMFAVYTMATSVFKLIEAIPNHFGRWIGISGGFGSMIKMGTDGGKAGMAASAFVIGQGMGIVDNAASLASKPLDDREEENKLKEEYEKWRTSEVIRVAQYNQEAADFNSTISGYNAYRASIGLAPVPERQFRAPPPTVSADHFKNTREAGLKSAPRVYGDLYNNPPGGGGGGGTGGGGTGGGGTP